MHFRSMLVVAPMLALASVVQAQTVVTPANMQGWAPNSLQGTGTVAITSAQPRGLGTGSLEINHTAGTVADRTRFELDNFAPGGLGALNQLTTLSFDWWRSSSSTTSAWLTPVFRLHVYDPTLGAARELVWEYDYQFTSGNNIAPVDQWINDQNLLAGNWYIGGNAGPGCQSLYAPCRTAANNFGFSSSTVVYGISIGSGSGWTGTFRGFADDVRIGFGTQAVTRYDFEVSTVPEPSTYALMAAGLAALGLVARRRRTA